MSCKRLASIQLAGTLTLLLIINVAARADTIAQPKATTYGQIVSISPQAITLLEGCTGAKRAIPWSDIWYITIDNKCGGTPLIIGTAPMMIPCPKGQSQVSVWSVRFKANQITYANQVQYDDGQPAVITLPSRGTIQGPLNEVFRLEQKNICSGALNKSENFKWPPSFSPR